MRHHHHGSNPQRISHMPHMQRMQSDRPPAQLTCRHLCWAKAILVVLFASGIAWLALVYGLPPPDIGVHPWAPWSLKLHGAAAMAALVLLGTLLIAHVGPAWRERCNRTSGVIVLTITTTLILTGYGLYYLAGDGARAIISVTHWALGVIGLPALLLHIYLGRRSERARRVVDA